ncbi:MAG: metallophosphoesterase [Clostridia bacterium]|nr:metallophosphoesterase [Clostridia bacterium]
MKIGLFTDPHYCTKDVTCRTRRPLLSYGKIREAMQAFADAEVDLVICLGDLVDECGTEEENTAEIVRLTEMMRSFGVPFFSLMGNHDYENFRHKEFCRYANPAPGMMRCGDSTLIFLDANYSSEGIHRVYKRHEIDWTDAYVPRNQSRNLAEILAQPETVSAYVFLHQNLDPDVEKRHIVRNAAEIREIIRASGKVRAVYQGHYHPGHENVINGIPYHTLPAMCEGEENRYFIAEL